MFLQSDLNKIISEHKIGKSLVKLAEDFSCSPDKIRYYLKKHNALILRKPAKCYLPEQEIINLYKSDISIEKISKKYNISASPIVFILKKHNVRKPNWLSNLSFKFMEKVLDKQYFQNLVDKEISQKNLMNAIGCGQEQITSLCKYHNINLQNSGLSRSLINRKQAEYSVNFDNFKQLYVKERLNLTEVSNKFCISIGYLKKLIKEEWNCQEIIKTNYGKSSEKYAEIKNNKDYLLKLVKQNKTILQISKEVGCCQDRVCILLKKHKITVPKKYRSTAEKEIEQFIIDLNPKIKILICNKKLIYPNELDIYLPEYNLAIEYCGLYWHGENRGKNSQYHLNKLEKCNKLGIRLITIFEDEYIYNKKIVLSKIKQIIGLSNNIKVNARSCYVKEISNTEKRIFLENNHIQGNDKSRIKLGLFDNKNNLVSVMTFARPSISRASNNMVKNNLLWELNRFASNINLNVRGSAGKLLSYFKNNYEWSEIYSYADKRWSIGNLYHNLGFNIKSISKPNYWYINRSKREYRYKFAKFKLIEEGFDPNKTEQEIMNERGIDKIWDCGSIKFNIISCITE